MSEAAFAFAAISSCSADCDAVAKSALAFSAAFRPSAILRWRSEIAATKGGHTNFMQNITKMANAIDCPIRVALIFT